MSSRESVSELLKSAAGDLAAAGVAEARREASSLLSFAIGRERTFVIAHPDFVPSTDEIGRFRSVVARRASREPLQYIIGKQEFYGLEFEVAPGVLIPRPETEILVEKAVEFLASAGESTFCEVGVGSGCISAAILTKVPDATAIGLEISPDAISIAERNARKLDVLSRLEFRLSDVFSALAEDERFEAIVTNPPYVPLADLAGLQPEVRDHEPVTSLSDGADGLSIVRMIVEGAPNHLKTGGLLLVEIGFTQSSAVAAMLDRKVWDEAEFLNDLQGIPRILCARLRSR